MRLVRTFTVILAIHLLLLVTASFAQQGQPLSDGSRDGSRTTGGSEKAAVPEPSAPEAEVLKASAFVGSSVMNRQNENLGKIEDLVIDPMTGQITYAALSYGSILGLGGKLFAIAWDTLELLPGGESVILNIPKETLENLPGFDKNNWPKRPDPVLRATARKTISERMESKGSMAEEALSATVQEVNVQAETVVLRTDHEEIIQLQVPPEMLTGLQAGDVVEVKMSGMQAAEIRKMEGRQQPAGPGNRQEPQQQSNEESSKSH